MVAACGASPATTQPAAHATASAGSGAPAWQAPAGWKSEVIPFPLDFAPALAHRGVEELRFAPGMFDPSAPGYFSYAFAWRLQDSAQLTADQLGDELTAYFRGLLVAVDGDKNRIVDPTLIELGAASHDDLFVVTGTIVDTFTTGQLVELFGFAHRSDCPGGGALWTLAIAPDGSEMLDQVREVAMRATCDQQPAK
jgi:hypothetical protein